MAAPPTESNLLADLQETLVPEIDYAIKRALRSRGLPGILEEACLYATAGGGKRLRPVLTLLSAEAVGGDRAAAMLPAVALELIHTFSLVHDDLPAMDDDALRRGRPTLHVQAGEAMAILAGDAMLSIAFELVSESDLDAEVARDVTIELATACSRMIAGQTLDVAGGFPSELSDVQRMALVHRHKTGALIRAACRIGGRCGGGDEGALDALNRFGEAVGSMFQIVDDLLDVTQSSEHLGKRAGKDAGAGKLTAPGVLGIEAAANEVERLRIVAREALSPLGPGGTALATFADVLAARTR